jgi:26S proteasome regulatory subunit N3
MIQFISTIPVTNDNKPENSDADVNVDAQRFPVKDCPEIEVYVSTVILTTLIRENNFEQAASFSSILIDRIKGFNRRSLDLLSSKAFFYFSLAFEKINKLENIRSTLLTLYRTACLRHDEMGQAVLLNLLLRNYLHYNLVIQAQTLISKSTFPENASNNQFCRYLYYMGRIQAVQLEYSDAYIRLTQVSNSAMNKY